MIDSQSSGSAHPAGNVYTAAPTNQWRDNATGKFVFGGVEVDSGRRRVFRDGSKVRLALKEYELLMVLASNAGRPVPYDEIRYLVWNNSIDTSSRTIAQHILVLRKKLENDPARPEYIQTHYKYGYVLAGEWRARA